MKNNQLNKIEWREELEELLSKYYHEEIDSTEIVLFIYRLLNEK